VAGARRDTLDRPCYFEYSGEMFPTKIPAEFLPQRERERERERDARRELDPTARRCAESNLKEKFSCIAREAGRPLAFPIRDFDFPPIVEIEPLSLAELSPPLPLPLPPRRSKTVRFFSSCVARRGIGKDRRATNRAGKSRIFGILAADCCREVRISIMEVTP